METPHPRAAFTLVELLVVIGIISILIAVLLPALNRAQAQAKKVQCMANENQIGQIMLIYANDNNGYLYPPNLGWDGSWPTGPTPPATAQIPGSNPPQFSVWPYYVFKTWNPKYMICPADPDPGGSHSYLASSYLWAIAMDSISNLDPNANRNIAYSTPLPNHVSPSQVIVLGEKVSQVMDYYMDPNDFGSKVAQFRHGLPGSNYLFLDMHVETQVPTTAQGLIDPWEIP